MLQRIQTVYLFLNTTILIVFSFFTDFSILNFTSAYLLNHLPAIFSIVVSIFSIGLIFLFKNRKLQSKLSFFLAIDVLFVLGFFIYLFGVEKFYLEWTFYLLPVSFGLLLLARNSIKKDEKLVKSADRLR